MEFICSLVNILFGQTSRIHFIALPAICRLITADNFGPLIRSGAEFYDCSHCVSWFELFCPGVCVCVKRKLETRDENPYMEIKVTDWMSRNTLHWKEGVSLSPYMEIRVP